MNIPEHNQSNLNLSEPDRNAMAFQAVLNQQLKSSWLPIDPMQRAIIMCSLVVSGYGVYVGKILYIFPISFVFLLSPKAFACLIYVLAQIVGWLKAPKKGN